MNVTLIVAIAAVVASAVGLGALTLVLRYRRHRADEEEAARLQVQLYGRAVDADVAAPPRQPRTADEAALDQPLARRLLVPSLARLGRMALRISPQRNVDEVRRLLEVTQDHPWPVTSVLALQLLCLLGGAGLTTIVGVFISRGLFLTISIACVGAVLGFFYPRAYLRGSLQRRQDELERALPDFLDLLTVAIEAGLSLPQAIKRAAQDDDSLLHRYIKRAIREYELGVPILQALRQMSDALQLPSLTNVVRIMMQSQKLGTSLGKHLRADAQLLRHQQRMRARELGQQAPIKMMLPMMGCIFPTLLAVILGPAAVTLLVTHH